MSVTVQPFGKWQAIVLPYNQGQTDHDRLDRISRNIIMVSYGYFDPVSPARRLYTQALAEAEGVISWAGRWQTAAEAVWWSSHSGYLQLIGEC